MTDKNELEPVSNNSLLVDDIRQMIEATRSSVATAVNIGLTMLYWHIGKRIREEILQEERGEYGQEIVATLSRQLSGSHFKDIIPLKDPLQREFYLTYPEIGGTLSPKFGKLISNEIQQSLFSIASSDSVRIKEIVLQQLNLFNFHSTFCQKTCLEAY